MGQRRATDRQIVGGHAESPFRRVRVPVVEGLHISRGQCVTSAAGSSPRRWRRAPAVAVAFLRDPAAVRGDAEARGDIDRRTARGQDIPFPLSEGAIRSGSRATLGFTGSRGIFRTHAACTRTSLGLFPVAPHLVVDDQPEEE